ncbi:hypothetical protein L4C38_08190 [Vibrio kasasachensis]|uniref:hypothetical protein n=1 Tax=Vibrio kasasachensis TaxID=2910248 RepID=UPI003D0DF2A4
MDREKNNTDADCESYLRNLQQMIADLIGYVEVKAKGKGLDRATALRQSQLRLLKYKELLLHESHIEESELLLSYIELSKIEKSIAKLGVQALSITIDALE